MLNNPLIYLWGRMWHYAGVRRPKIVLTTIMFVFANFADAISPLIFAYFLNFIQTNGVTKGNVFSLILILGLFLLSEITFWIFWGPARIIEQQTAFITKKNYKEYLLAGTMVLPLDWHADHHSGDTIDKIEKGANAIFDFSEATYEPLKAIVLFIVSMGALIYYNLLSSIVVIIISSFSFYIMFQYDKRLVRGYKIVNKFENKTSAKVFDVISNITTVIVLRIEKLVFKTISKSIDEPFTQFKKNIINNEWKWIWASVLGAFSIVLMISFYILINIHNGHTILIGSIYILYSYVSKIKDTFFSFAHVYNKIIRQRAKVTNAEELSKDFINTSVSYNKILPKNWNNFAISNLSFSYHSQDDAELHLDNVNVQFKKGERIAVIGESGGGKTTFLKLFRGLYEPKSIDISIDGKNYKDFNSISDSISLIPQDPEIFSTTIRENITLGVDYTDTEIHEFTNMASFSDVVERLPRGLESNIVEKGVNLSGGEKQRLALSRGLLFSTDKEIILLDEPTSSVDFHNELQIYENIFASFKGKTIISSIHRLHLLSLFDNIYFFKEGSIVASGNLDKLKQSSPDFQELWDKYIQTQNQ